MWTKFDARGVRFAVLTEIERVWGADDFLALSDLVEFGDTSGIDADELRDMRLLSRQDLEPTDAAARQPQCV